MFIKEIMSRVMSYKIDKFLKRTLGERRSMIARLYRILLQDSTVISLPDTLKRLFRGCGGSASEAAVKCDFIIDQSNHLICLLYTSCRRFFGWKRFDVMFFMR